jgi:hypothetical protein
MNEVVNIKVMKHCFIFYFFITNDATISLNSLNGSIFVMGDRVFFICEIGTNFIT